MGIKFNVAIGVLSDLCLVRGVWSTILLAHMLLAYDLQNPLYETLIIQKCNVIYK